MKQKIMSAVMAICMALILFPTLAAAEGTTTTAAEFLKRATTDGVITLTEDVTLTDALVVNDGSTLVIDLKGYTLQLTKPANYITNGSNVTIKGGGTVNINNVISSGDCIIGIGDYSNTGTLKFDNVTLTGADYSSPYAVLYVYGASTLDITGSTVTLTKDISGAGGAIKSQGGINSIINITNSSLNLTDTVRGIVDGTVTIDNSTVTMTGTTGTAEGLDNGINSGDGSLKLTIKNNSNVTITGYTGRGLTVDGGSTITVIDSNVTTQGVENSEGGIMFKATATDDAKVSFEGTSSLTADTIVVAGTKANVDMSNDTTLNVEEIDVPETVKVEDVVTLPANYGFDENGNVEVLTKIAAVNGKQYATIQAAVDAAGTTPSTITLLGDAAGNGFVVNKGQNITFNFADYTYTINGELVGSEGTQTLCAQLLKGSAVTFKNGILTSTNGWVIIQNYCDLTLENFNVDGTKSEACICTISNNNGSLTVKGDSDILSTEDAIAVDIYYWPNGGYDTVDVIFDESYTGNVVGQITYGPSSGANASDETVAEKLSLTIKGQGSFDVEFVASSSNDIAAANIRISSGTFTEDPSRFCVDGFAPEIVGGKFVVEKAEAVAKIGNTEYTSLAEAVAAVPADGEEVTITLLKDVTYGTGVVVNAGQNIVIDFNGKTYNAYKPLVGSAGTETNGFQFLKGATVTLKNGTLTTSNNEAAILVQNYSDLSLIDMNLVGIETTRYVLSNNFGDILVTGESDITATEGNVAFDLWYGMSSTYADGITVIFDENYTGAVTGIIEYGAATGAAEGWEDKVALRIKGGNFQRATLKASNGNDLLTSNVEISGGTFDADLASVGLDELCAEHFAQQINEDGTYGVHLHVLTAVAAKETGCTEDGNNAYWYCATCGVHYSDDAGVNKISADSVKLPALGHTETLINAESSNCGTDGYTGDVVCSTCNTTLQEGSVIKADGNHHWSEWKNQEGIAYTFRECWNCGASEYLNADTTADAPKTDAPATSTSAPATGDTSNMFVWITLMVVCCGVVLGTMVYRKNK